MQQYAGASLSKLMPDARVEQNMLYATLRDTMCMLVALHHTHHHALIALCLAPCL